MSESSVYRPFMELLRAGLWNRTPDSSLFPLHENRWVEIHKMAQQQTVTGILYDGILLLSESCQPPLDILLGWAAEVEFLERGNRSMSLVVTELHRLFMEEGLAPVLQKGQGLAALYPHPLHRVCGDIDWYFPSSSDRAKAVKLLSDRGMHIEKQAGFSVCYVCKGVAVEHHGRLWDCHNPFVQDFLRDLEERETINSMRLSLDGEEITLPSALENHLLVNLHILKHMLSFGIGFRQLCDSACVCRSLHGKTDGAELEKVYRKTGIYRWILTLHELLVTELGLPEEYLPFPRLPGIRYDWMLHEIWSGGNFGFHDSRYGGHDTFTGARKHVWRHWFHRFRLHLRYAPQETLWFPVMQVCSRFLWATR